MFSASSSKKLVLLVFAMSIASTAHAQKKPRPKSTPPPTEATDQKKEEAKARFEKADASQDFSALVRLIHAAYEVLRDDAARRAYDATLASEAARADVELKSDLDAQAPRRVRRVQDVPHPLNAAFSTLAA